MYETMEAVNGVGLAGPQVGIGQAIFVFNLEGRRGHVINPVIETWGDITHEPREGCLSVPELYYTPPRAQFAKVQGVNSDGDAVEYEGEGLFARMLQHEVDHLNGYLFVDRLEGEQRREARRAMVSSKFMEATQKINSQRSHEISSTFGSGATFGQATS
ncbi:peptide deformylase [Enteractinococcus coprophilus]